MAILIVVESLFGNTRAAADAIAQGLNHSLRGEEAQVVDVADAPRALPDGLRILLVGGPTHAFSMTRESTRADAVREGAPTDAARVGIREWIADVVPRNDVDVITFDTRVKVPGLPGSAAKSAAKALRERGFARVERGRTFWVHGKPGPIDPTEIEQARAWGEDLAAALG